MSSASPAATVAWRAERLDFTYPGARRRAVEGVDLEAREGELVAILGPNGSGKSTLLRLLLGVRAPEAGKALLYGRAAHRWPAERRARRVGVLPQHEEPAFPIRAGALVETGRYPWLGRWGRPGPEDRRVVAEALRRCGVADLAERDFSTLSGGERQRVRLARALAQEPGALALDEPTASLDLAHEMEIWELLREEAREGRAVLLTTHHLNLAARYAGRLVLLDRGRVAATGAPRDVLVPEVIEGVYGWPVRVVPHRDAGPDRGAPQVVPLRESGSPLTPTDATAARPGSGTPPRRDPPDPAGSDVRSRIHSPSPKETP
ncbi:MAG: ABC transporter ATP-binding protein [Gemmatimonadota bacterium]|nr:ABC transporter ATP-binding protein [Gemmatimonadota bacterium]